MKILYVCGDWPGIHGGVYVIYKNVETLTQAGFDARVLHFRQGFRSDWIPADVQVDYIDSVPPTYFEDSIIVIPEGFGPNMCKTLSFEGIALDVSETPIVIFNQNHAQTFHGWGFINQDPDNPYCAKNLLGVITVSRHDYRFLSYLFPSLPIYLKQNSIDSRWYYPEKKENIITVLLRKHRDECESVLNGLHARGALHGYRLAVLHNVPKAELAGMLRRSSIYLGFGYPESFGLPAAEALAAGCTVVGYDGFGGEEFFDVPSAYAVPEGDVFQFVRTAEAVLSGFREGAEKYVKRAAESSREIQRRYSPEIEQDQLVKVWKGILRNR